MVASEKRLQAAVLLYPGCTIAEVIELATRLANAGAEVAYVASSIQPVLDQSGLRLEPNRSVDEIDPAALDVLVIPGGDPEAIIEDDKVSNLVAAARQSGAVVAGICAGVLVMAAAGVLRGRSITHNYRAPWASPEIAAFVERFWEQVDVEADPSVGVVIDGPIISALPNAAIEFAVMVCRRLDLYSPQQADKLVRHLRGEYVPDLC